jgi:uncharacterized protein (TIGR02246 family)
MKRIGIAVGLAVLVLGIAILAKTQTGVEQELIKLEKESGDSFITHDPTAFANLTTDDYTGTMPDGTVLTKAQVIEAIKSSEVKITSIVDDELRVRVYGNAAVVTGRLTTKIQVEGVGEITSQERFTDTWIRQDGSWKCAAGHNSEVSGGNRAYVRGN